MKYTYTGGPDGDQYYSQLGRVDLDDTELTDEQVALLMIAVQRGYYQTRQDLLAANKTEAVEAFAEAALVTVPRSKKGVSNDRPTDD